MNADHRRVPESKCPKCGYTLDAVGQIENLIVDKPEPGDLTVCLKCLAVLVFDKNMKQRTATAEEMHENLSEIFAIRRAILESRR